MEVHQYGLTIAGIPLRLVCDQELLWEEEFLPFRTDGPARYTARFRQVEALPPIPAEVWHEGLCDRVHPDGKGGYVRSFFDAPRSEEAYGVGTYDYPHGQISVDYLAGGARCVSEMQNSFYHIGLEALLRQEGKFCLHAACVETAGKALLFSGPSGRGKSTQADLWCHFRGAEMLNGDRPILGKQTDRFTAWGSPYAGSSRCYVNRSAPIAALVMLDSWGACQLRRLPLREAFRRIYQGLTMYSWDGSFSADALDFAVALAGSVPVYGYHCTAGEESVDYLEQRLREDGVL